MEAKLKGLPDSEVTKLVNDAIHAQNDKADDKKAEEKSAEMRALEGVLANRVYDRLLTGGYVDGYLGPIIYGHPLSYLDPLYGQAAAIKAYSDYVLGYEAAHHIAPYVYHPDLLKILNTVHAITGST